MSEELERTIFQIILHGGNGRSFCMEAIAEAKKGDFAAAKEKIRAADEELIRAHHF